MIRPLLLLGMLAGCATGPLAPDGTDYVELSSVSPAAGTTTKRIYANDALLQTFATADGAKERTRWSLLPKGSYDNAREIVKDGFPRVTDASTGACPAGLASKQIIVSAPIAGQTSVQSGCMPNGFDAVEEELQQLLPPWSNRDNSAS